MECEKQSTVKTQRRVFLILLSLFFLNNFPDTFLICGKFSPIPFCRVVLLERQPVRNKSGGLFPTQFKLFIIPLLYTGMCINSGPCYPSLFWVLSVSQSLSPFSPPKPPKRFADKKASFFFSRQR